MPLMSFEEAMALAGDASKTVLLGNGFSMAYDTETFRYFVFLQRLRENPDFANLVTVFDVIGTDDFEKVMNALHTSLTICNNYNCTCEELNQIRTDEIDLKLKLIEFISDTHPRASTDISDAKYRSTRMFLSKFSEYYTTNYDLLLYWALLRSQVGGVQLRYNDGFSGIAPGELTWAKKIEQTIFYIHGAMHLYKNHHDVVKLRYNSTDPLRTKVRERIIRDDFPLFVAGRNSAEKIEKIESNRYLRDCMERFSVIDGALFIHGHSIDDNDAHIWDVIAVNPNIRAVFISLIGDEGTHENIAKIARAARLATDDRPVKYYSAESANLWTELPET